MPKAAQLIRPDGTPGSWSILCPACNCTHVFDSRWSFNGDVEKPTFRPSMLEKIGPFPEGSKRAGQIQVCHSYVTDGNIQFLGDCTHKYANQTLPLPDTDSKPKMIDWWN